MSDSNSHWFLARRLLRRKLSFWRFLTFFAILGALVFSAHQWGESKGIFGRQIARVTLDGMIVGERPTLELLDNLGKNPTVSAIIVSINSPGGTTSGSEAIYQGLQRLRNSTHKPVVAVVTNMAASGAYIAALGCDRIVAQGSALVGSIGVLFQYPDVSKLLQTLGVKMEEVKTSPLKAAPNGYEPPPPEVKAALNVLIQDSFAWFKGLVKERRQLSDEQLLKVSDGRVFSGRQGIELGLVDELGGEQEAIAWMQENRQIPARLPVKDWKPEPVADHYGLFASSAWLSERLGLTALAHIFHLMENEEQAQVLGSGLVSIWRPGVEGGH